MGSSTRFAGRSVVVTGAGSGIGRATALRFAAEGAKVLVADLNATAAEETVKEIDAAGGTALAVVGDLGEQEVVERVVATAVESFGRLDVLVNNAGVAGGFTGAPSEATADDLREVYETNVFGVVTVTNAMLPLLRRSAAGRIVNLSSHVGSLTLNSNPGSPLAGVNMIAYQSSKTALNAVTVAYAKELRGTPIKVNAALPGVVATDINHHRGHRTPAEGAVIAVRLALLDEAGPSGECLADDGSIPW